MSNFSQFVTGANEREREGREGGREKIKVHRKREGER